MSELATAPVAPATAPETAAAPAAAPTAPTAAPAAPEAVSPRLAALVQKQKEIAAAHLAQQAQAKALAEREQSLTAAAQAQAAWEARLKTDPVAALAERGVTYDDLTARKLGLEQDANDPAKLYQSLADEVKSLKEERVQETLAAQRAAVESAVTGFKNEISAHVAGSPDKYKHIAAFDGHNLIFDTIDAEAAQSGKVMSISEAAELVEAYLEAEAKQLLAKLPGAPAVATAPAPSAGSDPASSETAPQATASEWGTYVPTPRKLKGTLSNAVGAAVSSSPRPAVSKPTAGMSVDDWIRAQQKR